MTRLTSIPNAPSLTIYRTSIETVEKFSFLGSTLTLSGSCEEDIRQRIRKARAVFNLLNHCLWLKKINKGIKLRIYVTNICPIMMCASETWTPPASIVAKIDAADRCFMRRVMSYSWPRVVHNVQLYKEVTGLASCAIKDSKRVMPSSKMIHN